MKINRINIEELQYPTQVTIASTSIPEFLEIQSSLSFGGGPYTQTRTTAK